MVRSVNSLLATAAAIAVLLVGGADADEPRTWTDSSGKHEVIATLVAVEDGAVRLMNADGKEVTVPLDRLSSADRRFALRARHGADGAAPEATDAEQLKDFAEQFFADLRTKERKEAASLLTAAAQKLVADGKSALTALPKPDEGDNAIRVGKTKVDGAEAIAPVFVRAGGDRVKTALHFTQEDGEWRVAAISATTPGGERTIRFDKGVEPKKVDPLLALVGNPMPLQGLTLDGEQFQSDSLAGKVVLVDFWATWCGPCKREMPNIAAAYKEYHDRGFEVVAVSVDSDMEDLAAYVEEHQPPWTVLADRHPDNKRSMGGKYGVQYLPSLVLIGRDGSVAAVNCRGKALAPAVAKELRKRGPDQLAAR